MIEWIELSKAVEYSEALKIMEAKLEQIILNKSNETVYLLEHKDVYTAGTSYKEEELLGNSNIPVIYTGRGGKYTYHGPGQAVIYPLIDLMFHFLLLIKEFVFLFLSFLSKEQNLFLLFQ